MPRPCEECGQFVERVPDGRAYNDDGTWHKNTCVPDPAFKKFRKLERAEWEALQIKGEDRRERRPMPRLMSRRTSN